MILYIIRHAIAVQAGTNGSAEDDSQRPLTDEGRKKMRKIAKGLKELEVQIDLVMTSPYLRAAQTTKILAKKFDLSKEQVITTDNLMPTGYPDRLIDEINKKYSEVENLVLVGHEPYVGNLISMLISGDPTNSITLKKGGVCRLSLESLQYGRCAALDWMLSPAQLVEIGG
jgi:phosphohistidine phosphatase